MGEYKMSREKRRTSIRLGPLDVPEDLIPTGVKLRWCSSNQTSMARKTRLGYEVVNANSPEFKDLANAVGDGTFADDKSKKGSLITKVSKGGSELILMQISEEIFREHEDERRRETDRREALMGEQEKHPDFYGKELKSEYK